MMGNTLRRGTETGGRGTSTAQPAWTLVTPWRSSRGRPVFLTWLLALFGCGVLALAAGLTSPVSAGDIGSERVADLTAHPSKVTRLAPRPATQPIAQSAPAELPADRPSAAAGMAIFQERCAACHGPTGRGDGEMAGRLNSPPPDLSEPESARRLSAQAAYEIITNGRLERGMPPWADALDENERWATVAAGWAFHMTPFRMQHAASAWSAHCAECHGQDGSGAGLGGEPADAAGTSAIDLAAPQWTYATSADEIVRAAVASDAHAGLLSEIGGVSEARADSTALELAALHVLGFGFEPFPAPALQAGGRIDGRVVNGTDPALPHGASAVVAVATGVPIPEAPITASVSADGSFAFEDLLVGEGVAYHLVALRSDAEYEYPEAVEPALSSAENSGSGNASTSGLADADSSVPVDAEGRVELTVFEGSSDVEIRALALHTVIVPRPEAGVAEVVERWVLDNRSTSARTASGPDDPTVRYGLLPGAHGLRFNDGMMRREARFEGDTLLEFVPVPPGGREAILIYEVPYRGTELDISRDSNMPIDIVTLVVSDPGAVVESPGLPQREAVEIMGRAALRFSGGGVTDGERIVGRVVGLPEARSNDIVDAAAAIPATEPIIDQTHIAWGGALLGGLAILMASVLPLLRSRGGGPGKDIDRAIGALVALERERERGDLSPNDYSRRRAKLLDAAISLAPGPTAGPQVPSATIEPRASGLEPDPDPDPDLDPRNPG